MRKQQYLTALLIFPWMVICLWMAPVFPEELDKFQDEPPPPFPQHAVVHPPSNASHESAPHSLTHPKGVSLMQEDSEWLLSGNFPVPLTPPLEDAVRRGVPIWFSLEFQLIRFRWWWTNEMVAEKSLSLRLSYNPLMRQFRVKRGGLSQSFESLEEALSLISSVRGWRVFGAEQLTEGSTYNVKIRLRLDPDQLPKPFQVNAITDSDWNPLSEWTRLSFTLPMRKSSQ